MYHAAPAVAGLEHPPHTMPAGLGPKVLLTACGAPPGHFRAGAACSMDPRPAGVDAVCGTCPRFAPHRYHVHRDDLSTVQGPGQISLCGSPTLDARKPAEDLVAVRGVGRSMSG